jgi:hypothetical protein
MTEASIVRLETLVQNLSDRFQLLENSVTAQQSLVADALRKLAEENMRGSYLSDDIRQLAEDHVRLVQKNEALERQFIETQRHLDRLVAYAKPIVTLLLILLPLALSAAGTILYQEIYGA